MQGRYGVFCAYNLTSLGEGALFAGATLERYTLSGWIPCQDVGEGNPGGTATAVGDSIAWCGSGTYRVLGDSGADLWWHAEDGGGWIGPSHTM